MTARNSRTRADTELKLAPLTHVFVDEIAAHAFVQSKRGPEGPNCPRCTSRDVDPITPKPGSVHSARRLQVQDMPSSQSQV